MTSLGNYTPVIYLEVKVIWGMFEGFSQGGKLSLILNIIIHCSSCRKDDFPTPERWGDYNVIH